MTQVKAAAEAVLQLKRTFPAPRHTVFQSWTEPERLKKWWGPEGYETPAAEVDLRVGGQYRFQMRKLPDGQPFYLVGKYLEVKPPEKLVYTWSWQGKDMMAEETRVTVEFRDLGDATELVLTHELFPNTEWRDRHNQGWTGCLQRLENVFAPR